MKMNNKSVETVTVDVLKEKEARLSSLAKQSLDAVTMVSRTIESLQGVNNEISSAIEEIATYQARLDETKDGLVTTQSKNGKIISNFKVLLEID